MSAAIASAVEDVAAWAWRASWQGAVLAGVVAVVIKVVGRRLSRRVRGEEGDGLRPWVRAAVLPPRRDR